MRIHTQNLLAIVPLFLFLAGVSCALLYVSERGEYLWGMREEAASLAVATAEFMEGDAYRALVAGDTRSPYLTELRVPLGRILKRGQAKRILALTPDGSRAVAVFTPPATEENPDANFGVRHPRAASDCQASPLTIVSTTSDRHLPITPPGRQSKAARGCRTPEVALVSLRGRSRSEPFTILPPDRRGRVYSLMIGDSGKPAGVRDVESHAGTFLSGDGVAFVSEVQPGPVGQATLTAAAPILDSAGKRTGILAVETDARGFLATMHGLEARIAWIVGVVLLLGTSAALAISGFVTREVRELSRAAVEVKGGNLDRQIQAGFIQEIGDLGNTFNTMSDVLRDVLSRTKRSLIEAERSRTREDLAQAYVEQFWLPLDAAMAGVRVIARHLGARPAGTFYAAVAASDGAYAFVGRVHEAEALDAAVAASAAASLFGQLITSLPPEIAFARATELFSFETLQCLRWTATGDTAEWFCSAAPGAPVTRHAVCLADGAPFTLHTFDGEAASIIERYSRRFADLPIEELLADLTAALPAGAAGSLLMLARRPAGANQQK
jgi:HAMP domain-containing protein